MYVGTMQGTDVNRCGKLVLASGIPTVFPSYPYLTIVNNIPTVPRPEGEN